MMSKRYTIGDIHGGALGLKQCLDRAGFNYDLDELILLGDICDGWPETKECVELILKIKNFVFIEGNHDMWFKDYMEANSNITVASDVWLNHGGIATIESYKSGIPETHKSFFRSSVPYHVTKDNILFIHACYKPGVPLDPKNRVYYNMGRDLVDTALNALKNNTHFHLPDFKEVFVGHTPTIRYFSESKPVRVGNFFMVDTGACFDGVLTIMDIDTKQYWSSDPVMKLYPNHKGRNKKSYNQTR